MSPLETREKKARGLIGRKTQFQNWSERKKKKKQAKRERNNSPGESRIAVPDGPKSKACKEEEGIKKG
jgi:hypothetical protein